MKNMGLILLIALAFSTAEAQKKAVETGREAGRPKTEKDKEVEKGKDRTTEEARSGKVMISEKTKAELSAGLKKVLDVDNTSAQDREKYETAISHMSESSGLEANIAISRLEPELSGPNGKAVSYALREVLNIMSLEKSSTVTGQGLSNFIAETILGKTFQATLLSPMKDTAPLDAKEVVRRLMNVESIMKAEGKTAEEAFIKEFGDKAKGLKGDCY
jgi:hypothetical protein